MGEALEVVARETRLLVRVPAGVGVEPLNPLRVHHDDGAVSIELNDLVSGQEVDIVLAFTFPRGREGEMVEATLSLGDRHGALDAAGEAVTWTYGSTPRTIASRGIAPSIARSTSTPAGPAARPRSITAG